MAYLKKQQRGDRSYYYLVKSERNGKKVRQKVLQYLGTSKPSEDELKNIKIMNNEETKNGGI
jgi:hypothetical protein